MTEITSIYSIRHDATIGELSTAGGILNLSVEASVYQRPRSCRLSIFDPTGAIAEVAIAGAPLTFAWTISNAATVRLFTGVVERADRSAQRRVDIVAFDAWRRAQIEKFTVTYFNQNAADILRALVAERLGMEADGIADTDLVIDRFPLFRASVSEAVAAMHKRLAINRDAYVDEDGQFVWDDASFEPEDGVTPLSLVYGENMLDFDAKRRRIDTWAQSIRLRDIIDVTDYEGAVRRARVTAIRYQVAKKTGSRISLEYEPAPEEAA